MQQQGSTFERGGHAIDLITHAFDSIIAERLDPLDAGDHACCSAGLPQQHFKESASALVRDVLLLQAVNDQAQAERVGARLRELSRGVVSSTASRRTPAAANWATTR